MAVTVRASGTSVPDALRPKRNVVLGSEMGGGSAGSRTVVPRRRLAPAGQGCKFLLQLENGPMKRDAEVAELKGWWTEQGEA